MVMACWESITSLSLSPTKEMAGPLRTSKGTTRTPSTPRVDLATMRRLCMPSGILVVSRTNFTGGLNSAKGFSSWSKKTFMIRLSSMSKSLIHDDVFGVVGAVFLWFYQVLNAEVQGDQHNDGR